MLNVRQRAALMAMTLVVSACSSSGLSPSAPATATSAPPTSATSPSCDPSKKVKLAFMTKDMASTGKTGFQGMADTAKAWADANCVDLTTVDLLDSGDRAVSTVNTVIGAGVKGIVITTPDVSVGPAIASAAANAHVPLLALFDAFKDANGNPNPFYGLDDLAYGKLAGGAIVKLYQAAGWGSNTKLVVRGAKIADPTVPACVDRQDGAEQAIEQGIPGFTAQDVITVVFKNDEQTAINAMATTITAHPEVTNWLIWSCNDNGVTGAVRALESAGVPADHGIAVGQGGGATCSEFGKPKPTSYMGSTYQDLVKASQDTMKLVYDAAVNGTALPATTKLEGQILTRDNYKPLLGC